ncbi:hypothetical protein HWV62_41114 [Athelia sp. TMB]|nr:hypothetical protein HWV62_41114 [Athelia sp. TMB]
MECRLVSSPGLWTCRLSIRWEFDDEGKPLGKVEESSFGTPITNKDDVELALRRAQAAVLNPEFPPSFFVSISEADLAAIMLNNEKTLRFSRNVLCVDISGPDLTDLAFVDLPGIIQNAPRKMVTLVEDLVLSHIQGNCLILVALPMTDDIENQKALRLARQVDAEGQRTIGVMTKPDLLSAGSTKSREIWLDVMEGRRHQLTHGYYCTRQPDDADRTRKITAARAREAETEFFSKTSPWSTTAEQRRLGTRNLVATLSKLLVEIIDRSLPKLLSETISQLEVCDKRISTLPPVVQLDPISHMSNLVTSLMVEVNKHVQGGPGAERLIHDNRIAFASFKQAIRRTAPNFVPALNAHEAAQMSISTNEDEPISLIGEPFYLQDMKAHLQKSITRELPGKVPFEANVILIKAFQTSWARSTQKCFDQVQEALLKILRECVQTTFNSYEALHAHVKGFISESVKRHREACFNHLAVILETQQSPFTLNTHYLQASQDKWLGRYKDARAGRSTATNASPSPFAFGALSTASADPKPSLESRLSAEKRGGWVPVQTDGERKIAALPKSASSSSSTVNENFKWAEGKGAFPKPVAESSLFKREETTPSPALTPSKGDDNVLLAMLAARGFHGLTVEDLGRLNPSDEYEMELKIMAEKIIDIVPEVIDLTFVKAVAKDLQPYLYKKLGFGTTDVNARFTKFLAEDSQMAARRETLMSQKTRLERVKQELFDFGL